jgi:hypothetical protein
LPERVTVRGVELHYTHGLGVLRVYGLALHDAVSGRMHQVGPLDRAKFREAYRDSRVTLYENRAAFPRAFVVDAAVLPRGDMHPVFSMYLDPIELGSEVLLDAPPPEGPVTSQVPLRYIGEPAPFAPRPLRPATILRQDREQVVVQAETARPGYLVLTDLYHPGWEARVGGVAAPVLRGDHLFRVVPLPPGRHEVELVYDPWTVRVGRGLSLVTLAVWLVALVVLWRWAVLLAWWQRRWVRAAPAAGRPGRGPSLLPQD